MEEANQCLAAGGYEEAHECVKDAAKEAGLKYLGAGIHRAGFAFDTCVVKIALSGEGLKANQGEYEAWRQVGTHFKNIFAPVHDHEEEFLWITQPRLKPVSGRPQASNYETRLVNKMRKRGLDCGFDVRPHNIGTRAGGNEPFVYDYGFGLSCQLRTSEGVKTVKIKGAEYS